MKLFAIYIKMQANVTRSQDTMCIHCPLWCHIEYGSDDDDGAAGTGCSIVIVQSLCKSNELNVLYTS